MASGVHTEVLCSFLGGPKDGAVVRMPVADGKPPATVTVNAAERHVVYRRRRAGKRWVYEQLANA